MSDTVTPDMFPDMFVAVERESTQNRPSEHIKRATDRVAVERNHQLIDSFIENSAVELTPGINPTPN